MRAIVAADRWLIGRFQRAVDLSQRAPSWWCQHCALASAACHVALAALAPFSVLQLLSVLAGLFCDACAYLGARSPALLQIVAVLAVRMFVAAGFAATVGMDVALYALTGRLPSGAGVACDAGSLAWLCMHYFAACRPPEPRPPKRRLVLSTRAA